MAEEAGENEPPADPLITLARAFREMAAQTSVMTDEDAFDLAVTWLVEKMLAHDPTVVEHFWHLAEGDGTDCACPYEGEHIGSNEQVDQ